MGEANSSSLNAWIGTTQTCEDPLSAFPARALAALLGHAAKTPSTLPLPWHWLYAITPPDAGTTGVDGHPARGGFLPPVTLPRRMWAGSDIVVSRPLTLGKPARRTSTIGEIDHKHGRSGTLVFVIIDHVWTQGAETCLTERQTIVYRDAAASGPSSPETSPAAPSDVAPPTLRATLSPDPIMLFRYSALTYNAHRIHYDLPYATAEEGYPGLVVHGPLLATLLLDAAAPLIGGRKVARFSFRAERPAFGGAPVQLHADARGDRISLWSADDQGRVGVRAQLDFASA